MSRGIVPAVPRSQQVTQALLCGATLVLVAVGVPVVLVLVGGSPIPHGLVHAVRVDMSLRQLFSQPVGDSWIVHAAFALAWCAWLWLAVCVAVELASWASGRTAVHLPGSRTMQAVAACLVGTTLAVMVAHRVPGPGIQVRAGVSVTASSSTARANPPPSSTARANPPPSSTARVNLPPRRSGTPSGRNGHPSDAAATAISSSDEMGPGEIVARPGELAADAVDGGRAGETPLAEFGVGTGELEPGGSQPAGGEVGAFPAAQLTDLVVSASNGPTAPIAPSPQAAPAAPARTYLVQPHDTLWSIAASQLGSPLRWPEIAAANYGRAQPDGGVLTDAHWIYPGWVLVLPVDASDVTDVSPAPTPPPASPPPEPAPTVVGPSSPFRQSETPRPVVPRAGTLPADRATRTARPVAGARAAGGTRPAGAARLAAPAPFRSPAHPGRQEAEAQGPGPTEGGGDALPVVPIGAGLLGAGLVGIINRMRRAQQRHRRTGEQIRLPRPALSGLERRLRTSDDPLAPYAVDAALRLVASLPAPGARPVIVGVRVHPDHIELIPEEGWAGPVPDPFELRAGGASWFVPRMVLSGPEHDAGDRAAEAPCPALVTVGRSDSGPCLVNLEAMGSLAVAGDPSACDDQLRALALELATSCWADQFDLVLVGFGHELSRFERVRVVSDATVLVGELEHRARDGRALLHTAGYPTFGEARMALGSDTWDAMVVLCGPAVDAGEARDLVARGGADTGLAAVVCGEAIGARHQLVLDDAGGRSPLDLLGAVVWPQRVDQTELDGLDGLVATAADLRSVSPSDVPYSSITAPLPRARVEPPPGTESWVADAEQGADGAPGAEGEEGEASLEAGAHPDALEAPEVEVLVLGTVVVRGNARPFTRAWAKELVVYLAMHPGGVSNDAWATALWPDRLMAPSSLHSTASVARRSLGQARDGGDHLPKGHGRLMLAGTVGTDWDRFVRLADSSEPGAWHAAMELVRGRPFDDLRASDWPILEGLSAAVEASVVDVATRLAARCLASQDPAGAEWAARRGLLVSPYDERLYRMLLRAADLAGNPAGVESVMSELVHLVADDVEPFDSIHPETTDLYRALTRRRSFAPSPR